MHIAVMTNCRLGDSLAMLPALRLLRRQYPEAKLTVISEAAGFGIVAARDILGYRGVVDDFIEMRNPSGLLARAWERIRFIRGLRRRKFDLGIVLFPPFPPLTEALINRFSKYLKLGGVSCIVRPPKVLPMGLQRYPKAIDAIISVLSPLGIVCPEGEADYLLDRPADGNKFRLAVAPGANGQAYTWPKENFAAVLKALKEEFPQLVPVYFGGANEASLCRWLYDQVPGEMVTAKPLPAVEDALRTCGAYFGNDTGIMHFAAACGLKCVAVFSAHNYPGMWEPYGDGHIVLKTRENVPCAGCFLRECPKPDHPCMKIDIQDALHALKRVLGDR